MIDDRRSTNDEYFIDNQSSFDVQNDPVGHFSEQPDCRAAIPPLGKKRCRYHFASQLFDVFEF
jgi:hypothetical protein